jgi:3-phenylpropionate/trans-cinnamate dioxygenase ferredoxin subunit
MKLVPRGPFEAVGVYNCGEAYRAIEDRCSHDDGPLCEGEWDAEACEVECPRHGSRFDLRTGNALSLPAYMPVETYPVRVREDGMIVIDLGD